LVINELVQDSLIAIIFVPVSRIYLY